MKKYFMLLTTILLASAAGWAQVEKTFAVRGQKEHTRVPRETARKKADVLRVVPHMAVNNEWTSELTIRSDSSSETFVVLEFYDGDGNPVEATFLDSFGQEYVAEGFQIPDLLPYEIYSMNFGALEGARNMQIFVFTDETETNYSLEATYHRFGGGDKIASVGVPVVPPGEIFILNLDQRFDPDTGNRKFRGLAVSNNDGIDCNCEATLFNQSGSDLDDSGDPYPLLSMDIPASGKWVGDVYALYPDIDALLNDGLGYLLFQCDNPVSVLGLAFEWNTPVVASVPIDYFDLAKNKDGADIRVKRPR